MGPTSFASRTPHTTFSHPLTSPGLSLFPGWQKNGKVPGSGGYPNDTPSPCCLLFPAPPRAAPAFVPSQGNQLTHINTCSSGQIWPPITENIFKATFFAMCSDLDTRSHTILYSWRKHWVRWWLDGFKPLQTMIIEALYTGPRGQCGGPILLSPSESLTH